MEVVHTTGDLDFSVTASKHGILPLTQSQTLMLGHGGGKRELRNVTFIPFGRSIDIYKRSELNRLESLIGHIV